jgi:hypothetical protein
MKDAIKTEEHGRWATRILKLLAINLGILFAGLIATEVVFGGWIFGENYGAMPIPKDFKRRFDVEQLYGGGTSHFVRDEHGLRGTYSSLSEIDILTIGGSTTNELFVSEGQTWSDILAKAAAEDGRSWVVVNAGVDGQSTIGHLKNFELWFPKIPDLRFRYALAYIGINELGVAMSGKLTKWDHMEDRRRSLKRYLLNNSALYTLFRNIRGMVRARNARLIHTMDNYSGSEWQLPNRQPDIAAAHAEFSDHLIDYAKRLRLLAKLIREWGGEPIFVTQHQSDYRIRDGQVLGRVQKDGRVDVGHFAVLAVFNQTTLDTCQEVDAICIDLAGELSFEDGDHYDALHTTPQGSGKIGRYLYKKLRNIVR